MSTITCYISKHFGQTSLAFTGNWFAATATSWVYIKNWHIQALDRKGNKSQDLQIQQ